MVSYETHLVGNNGLNSIFGNDNFGKLNPFTDNTNKYKMLTIIKIFSK